MPSPLARGRDAFRGAGGPPRGAGRPARALAGFARTGTTLRAGHGGARCALSSDGQQQKFSQHLHCPDCNITYRDPVPNLFSFNSPLGRVRSVRGLGAPLASIWTWSSRPPQNPGTGGYQTLEWPEHDVRTPHAHGVLRQARHPHRCALCATHRGAAAGPVRRRWWRVRGHSWLVRLAGDAHVSHAHPHFPGQVPQLRHLLRVPRRPLEG